MGTCYSKRAGINDTNHQDYIKEIFIDAFNNYTNPEKREKRIKEICRNAVYDGDLDIIRHAYNQEYLDNSTLQKLFYIAAKYGKMNIIEWGFKEKKLDNIDNIEKILYIAPIDIFKYLINKDICDRINISNIFISSAFNGDICTIKIINDKYQFYDITYIIAYLGAYINNWGKCTKYIRNEIEKYFNNFIIEDKNIEYNFIKDNLNLKKKIKIFLDTFHKKINKNSDVNRLIGKFYSYPTGYIDIEYESRYDSTEDSEEDVYNIFINYILYIFFYTLFYFICIYLYLFYLFVFICIYFYLFIFNITKK